MRLGAGPIPLGEVRRKELREIAEQAARSSFDAVWLAESRHRGVGGALAAAAMVAQWTPIRIGAVVDGALYHPLHIAEDIAVADLAAQGRLEILIRFSSAAFHGYDSYAPDPSRQTEWLEVLVAATSGAHLNFRSEHYRIPAHLAENQPSPDRLAVNPRPAQPAVPTWICAEDSLVEGVARRLGFGIATRCQRAAGAAEPTGRWPAMLLCGPQVQPDELLRAAGDRPCYFLVTAGTAEEVATLGRRLAGPLRMPDFPDWVLA